MSLQNLYINSVFTLIYPTWYLHLYSCSIRVQFQSTCTCTCDLSTCTCTRTSGFGTCCHVGLSMELTQLNHVSVSHLQWLNASTVAAARISFILNVTYLLLDVFCNSKSLNIEPTGSDDYCMTSGTQNGTALDELFTPALHALR